MNHVGFKKLSRTVADLAARMIGWWVKIIHNICGLTCILGITSSNNLNQVSVTTDKRSTQGMVPPH